jgi:hypothetical protein
MTTARAAHGPDRSGPYTDNLEPSERKLVL